MAIRDWLRPPRYLVILFLGIALVLVSTLAWLGWRLFQQDRALEEQRVQVRLEHAADIVAAELTRRLGAIEDELTRLSAVTSTNLPDSVEQFARQFSHGAVVLILEGDDLDAYPNGRLFYYPVTTSAPEPVASVFAQGEALEFRRRDLTGAARAYRGIAQSSDSLVRAGALLRLARTERKAGRLDAALAAYDDLATLGSRPVGGLPAELVARHASLSVLDGMTRADDPERGARELYDDLHAGRWRLSRAQYEFHVAEVCRWIDCEQGADTTEVAARQTLTAGAEWVWNGRFALAGDGHELTWLDERPVLAVWHRSAERTVALVGCSTHIARDWLDTLTPTLQQQNVRAAFSDVNGNLLTPPLGSAPELLVTRAVADTRLPWTLHVASADPAADLAELGERRRLLLLGLATLALLVLVGLYAVVRGVSRELEAARLQSDFVAAVSHEFRTPLTSLRQLAEMLSSGRVASDERRARYYGIMERESGRLHRLVEGLLDFGRMEAGALEFRWEQVAPRELVRGVVTDFVAEQSESDYEIELADDEEVPAVKADAEALGRAVWNLLDNAVKYAPDGKTVRVTVSQENGCVVIAVRDEGVGIPRDELETVFKKFVRGSTVDGRGTRGTGIGLAMVKHIVEAHGGEVQVKSDVGQGSTFTILLPVEE